MNKNRKIKFNNEFTPLPTYDGDEIFRNGIFHFNISRIIEHIHAGKLNVEQEVIEVRKWFQTHFHNSINEMHLPTVDITKPIIQAEIRPTMYTIIDGNHRMEKAFREGVPYIHSYKLNGEELLSFFKDIRGYKAFIEYWNSKL